MSTRTLWQLLRFLALGASVHACDGCDHEAGYSLHIYFPSAQAEQDCTQLGVWALEPGPDRCADFVDGSVLPAQHPQVLLGEGMPNPPKKGPDLRQLPSGEVWMYVEGFDANAAWILSGCTAALLEPGGSREIAVHLEPSCTPSGLEELPGNGVDDNCNREVDECLSDAACDDHNPCTAELCVSRRCHSAAFAEGMGCDDLDPCTLEDRCGAGVCAGRAKDCSHLDGICLVGVCEATTGRCAAAPVADETGCDDGLHCTEPDSCVNGVCLGRRRSCDDGDPCTRDICDEGGDLCRHILTPTSMAEGLGVPGTCDNGQDDDCNGLVDSADPACAPCAGDGDCDDLNPCTEDRCVDLACANVPAADDTPCPDTLFCTVDERCLGGACTWAWSDCAEGSGGCRRGVCLEADGRCELEPLADGTPCDDGAFCTVGERCGSGVCGGGGARDCDDLDPCTADACDEDDQRCVGAVVPVPGAEGLAVEGSCANQLDDDCDGAADQDDVDCQACAGGCDDGNACTTNSCGELGCLTAPVENGTACDDADPCTMDDACRDGVCVGLDLDADDDGFVAASCGGRDCDDGRTAVNPDAREGLGVEGSCGDGLDNDCDGQQDAADPGCVEDAGPCEDSGWCWENPLPHGNTIYDLWVWSESDVWAVGYWGTIARWDGTRWRRVPSGTTKTLHGIWGAAPDDMWVVGYGWLGHWDGQIWDSEGGWSAGLSTAYFYGVWGVAPDDVWAVGVNGRAVHWDGSAWLSLPIPSQLDFSDVWGSASDDFVAIGKANSVSNTIAHWNGLTWGVEPFDSGLVSIWGRSQDEAWIVGWDDRLFRRQGADWIREDTPNNATVDYFGVWGSSSGALYLVGHPNYGIWVRDSGVWSQAVGTGRAYCNAIHGEGTFAASAGSYNQTAMLQDGTWAATTQSLTFENLGGIWAGGDEIWVVGDKGTMLRSSGEAWQLQPAQGSNNLNDIYGYNPSRLWVVGEAGTILRRDEVGWHDDGSPTSSALNSVWGLPGGEMWAVGYRGAALRRDAQSGRWESKPVDTTSNLYEVWGVSPTAIWASGYGELYRWNGEQWSQEEGLFRDYLTALWGSSASDVWLGGTFGLYHYDGNQWTEDRSRVWNNVVDITGTGPDDVWFLGSHGSVVSHNQDGWTSQPSLPKEQVRAIAISTEGDVWVTGGGGALIRLAR